MSETGIVAETAARIFADLGDPQEVNRDKNGAWKAPLWQALSDAGLTLAWVPEEHGGAGADIADGFAILGMAGRYAVAVPLAETLLAGWLLSRAGIAAPEGAMSVAPARPNDRITLGADGTLSGKARGVPFARDAKYLAVLAGSSIALVEAAACRIADGENLASEPSNTVSFDRVTPQRTAPAPAGFDQTALMLMGCATRAVQTAGALEAVLDFTVRYSNERVAFEKPIGKFQAVQHNLARLAGEVAAAMTAAHSAADAIARTDKFDDAIFLEATSAKIRSAEAAQEGAAIAHQVHGAIGFTNEHILHRYTLRMLGWRDDFGNESHWAAALGNRVAAMGADEFWPLVAAR
ncbi:MAG: acyl-CoA dehydrogenase [Hyphomicrobiales bacterium]|nr:acyl-CoA dehydrogenase [Hyphomicrobiales bacterium]